MESKSNPPSRAQLQQMQRDVDAWYDRTQSDLNSMHAKVMARIEKIRADLRGGNPDAANRLHTDPVLLAHRLRNAPMSATNNGTGQLPPPSTPPRPTNSTHLAQEEAVTEGDWSIVRKDVQQTPPANARREITPTGSPQAADKVPLDMLLTRIAQANNCPTLNFDFLNEDGSPNGNSPIPYSNSTPNSTPSKIRPTPTSAPSSTKGYIPVDSLLKLEGQRKTTSLQLLKSDGSRPTVVPITDGEADDPEEYNIDPQSKCEVLVEFKRKRVLQFQSPRFVCPGQYVIVGGDRGEDCGLVTYTWCETRDAKVAGIGLTGSTLSRSIGVGNGKVMRPAQTFEIGQLHGIQAELERRAVDVCQQRVTEHGLPMIIVDAEYQFDKKKLTFFYEAANRLDFRELVRDLFKTFRARIWMELVEN